jgi:hypothetical protein
VSKLGKTIFILHIVLIILIIPQFVKGYYFDMISFTTNKDSYYNYENIELNGIWELYYDPPQESFIQVQIYDCYNNMIWNSQRFSNVGYNEETWVIHIPDLDLPLNNESTSIFIKFFQFWDEGDLMVSTFWETLTIWVFKTNLTCQLTGFKNSILFGETTSFSAKFYETADNSALKNQNISLTIEANFVILSQNTYYTNELGYIDLILSSLIELTIGLNLLTFTILDNENYSNTCFSYNISVEKIPVISEVVNIDETKKNEGLIKIHLFYYFLLNESNTPLQNEPFHIKILQNSSIKLQEFINSSDNGDLVIEINLKSLNLDSISHKLEILVIFYGTEYFLNQTLSIIIDFKSSVKLTELNSIEFIFLSSIFSFVILGTIVIFKKKQNRGQNLGDIYVKI